MAVLPSFYDSFTKGRRDAIDFQNLIDERARKEAMFPEELRGKQIANQYTGAIRDRMIFDNQYNQELRPDKLGAERSGFQAATAGNQNTVGFYNLGNQMVDSAQTRASSPEYGMQNALFLRSLLTNPGYYGQQQLTPQANNNPFLESPLDKWIRENMAQQSGPSTQNLQPSPVSNSPEGAVPPPAGGGVNPIPDYNIGTPQLQGNASGRIGVGTSQQGFQPVEDIYRIPQKQAPDITQGFDGQPNGIQPDMLGTSPNTTPEGLVRGMTALGLSPELARQTLAYDAQLGLPPGILAALGYAESGFNPNAVSNRGAAGMWQIMPSNWVPYGGSNFNPNDPQQNLAAAVELLQERQRAYGADQPLDDLLRRYNGRMDLDLSKVDEKARAENLAFPGRVRDAYRKISGFTGP